MHARQPSLHFYSILILIINIILTRLVIPRLQDPNITQEENAEDVTLNMKMENVWHLIKYVLSATRRDTTVKFVKMKLIIIPD